MQVSTLKAALKRCDKAIYTKTSIRILGCYLFEAGWVTATNMETTVRARLDSGLTEAVAVQAGPLKKALGALKASADVTLSLSEGGALQLETASGTLSFDAEDIADWPALPTEADAVVLTAASCYPQLVDVARFESSDESRPVLCCTQLDFADAHELHVVATDSYTLGHDVVPIESDQSAVGTLVVPLRKALGALDEVDALAFVRHGSGQARHLVLSSKDAVVFVRECEGTGPAWRQLVPQSFVCDMQVPDGMLDAIKLAEKTVCNSGRVPLRMVVNGHVSLDARLQDGPTFSWESDEANANGELDGQLGFSAEFALKCAPMGDSLHLISALRPFVWGDVRGRFALQMPVRLPA